MTEYISREVAVENLQSRLDSISQMNYLNMDWHELNVMRDAIEDAIEDVKEVPVADVQPVKHGKWEQGKCTNCEKSLEDLFSGDFYWDDDELHFCPNCGARMDLKDGDTE